MIYILASRPSTLSQHHQAGDSKSPGAEGTRASRHSHKKAKDHPVLYHDDERSGKRLGSTRLEQHCREERPAAQDEVRRKEHGPPVPLASAPHGPPVPPVSAPCGPPVPPMSVAPCGPFVLPVSDSVSAVFSVPGVILFPTVVFVPVPVVVPVTVSPSVSVPTDPSQSESAAAHPVQEFIIKFADDTTVIGLITGGEKTAYRKEVAELVAWCHDNNLSLNADKTKEMIVDPRRMRELHTPLYIGETGMERVKTFKFLSIHISEDLI
ncbi:hypothetical protein MHYP_G00041470 [Metynnis hypsauchen]